MMATEKKRYTQEQLEDAERMARLLKETPPEKQNIIVMLGNAFIAGLEAGMQIPEKQEIGR